MKENHKVGVFSVASLGIGSMIGAGMFALIGSIGEQAGYYTWLVYVVAGIIALLVAYVYAKFSAKYPSEGGVTDYFKIGYKNLRLQKASGMLFVVTCVIGVAFLSQALAAYLGKMFNQSNPGYIHLYESLAILLFFIINLLTVKTVGKLEVLMVSIKLAIVAAFMIAGVITLEHFHLFGVPNSNSTNSLSVTGFFSSYGSAFLAYTGFGVMANTGAHMKDPSKNMPKAFLLAVIVSMLVYVIFSFIILSNVSPAQLAQQAETAVAQAAYPILGRTGFILVSIAAVLAISSAILAYCFAVFHMLNKMGKIGSLPSLFSAKLVGKSTYSFYIAIIACLLVVNIFTIEQCVVILICAFLITYTQILFIAWKKRFELKINPIYIVLAIVGILSLLFTFFYSTLVSPIISNYTSFASYEPVITIIATIIFCFVVTWKNYKPAAQNDAEEQSML